MDCDDYLLRPELILRAAVFAMFHYACYYPLARKMVRSEPFRHDNVCLLALLMSICPAFLTVPFIASVGRCGGAGGAPAWVLGLFFFGALVVAPIMWWGIIERRADGPLDASTSVARMFFLSFPFLGPLSALIWVASSQGLDQLISFDASRAGQRRAFIFGALVLTAFFSAIAYHFLSR